MNIPGKRLILGSAVAVAALGIGGVAYAAGSDPEPAPEQGYAVIEDGATTPSPSTQSNGRDDCPEKDGQGQGEQGQSEQGQSEQGQPSQSEQNPAGNA